MKEIWKFFENLAGYVYVADMETCEIVYANKRMMDAYGITVGSRSAGCKCYEQIHSYSHPCKECNRDVLRVGYFQQRRCFDPFLEEELLVLDSALEEDGRRYRVEIAIEMDNKKKCECEAEQYRNLEKLVNEGVKLAMRQPDPNIMLDVMLEYLGKALQGERTYIFEKNKQGGHDNTHEWVGEGVTPEKDNLQNVPSEAVVSWYRNFEEGRQIIIKDIGEIQESEPLQYSILQQQNIHSVVVVPLYDGTEIIGFFGVDNPPAELLEYVSDMLQIMGNFMISALKRRDLMRELEQMSYHDQLTGFGNRYAMEKYVRKMHSSCNIGVLYADVTGLKRVNDNEGHAAGDRLIRNAAECIRAVFHGNGLFRIGGDEFLVLCTVGDESVMKHREEELRKLLAECAVNLAIGISWSLEAEKPIDKLVSEAETRMYEDKSRYYKTAGIDRRTR